MNNLLIIENFLFTTIMYIFSNFNVNKNNKFCFIHWGKGGGDTFHTQTYTEMPIQHISGWVFLSCV